MLKGARGRRGFTLIETVVTVGIVATLAAVVVPQVVKQFDAADPARIQNDFKNIQTAIEMFSLNVRALPADLDDLTNPLVSTGNVDSTITTATTQPAFAGNEGTLWKGPYLDQTIIQSGTVDDFLKTGFGVNIVDSFVCYDSADNESGLSDATRAAGNATNDQACPTTPTGQAFLAVQVTGVSCSTLAGSIFMEINETFDGVGETNADQNGRIRCRAAGGNKTTGVAVVYFLAVPIS